MNKRKRVLPAGWYPYTDAECVGDISHFLKGFAVPQGEWTGGIAPHAGWFYSGRAAARVFYSLSKSAHPDRVVIYGGHLGAGQNPVVYCEDCWETPLGEQAMDSSFAEDAVNRRIAVAAPGGFADNTVEIQLPFVRHFFPWTQVIAIHAPASSMAHSLGLSIRDMLCERGFSAVYVGSADLTHYGPNYGFTPKGIGQQAVKWVKEENDKTLIEKALAMDSEGLLEDAARHHSTCSAGPFLAVMASVRRGDIEHTGRLIEYYTSSDITPNASFVGYAGIVY
jgi:MEMO1 family protein